MAGGFCIFWGGMNQCTQCVGWRRRDRGELTNARSALVGVAETGGGGSEGGRRESSLLTFGTFRH